MGIHSARKAIFVLLASAFALAGGANSVAGQSRTLTREQLAELDSEQLTAEAGIQRLRPNWLRNRPVIYIDGARSSLDRLQADEIQEIEYLDATAASIRYGTGHDGGALLVTSRTAGGAGGGLDINALIAEASGGTELEEGERPRDTDDTRDAEDHLEAGDDADDPEEKLTHYRMARTAAEAAIAEDPRNPLAHRLAALASLMSEDFMAAGEHFDHAQTLRPVYEFEDVGIREQAYVDQYQLASPLIQQGAYEEAAEYLENANAVYDSRPEAMITLAQIYGAIGEADRALEKIDEVNEFFASPAMTDADEETQQEWRGMAEGFDLMRGQVLAGADRLEEAVPVYRQLVIDYPDDLTIRQDLGVILMNLGETDQALEVYAEMLELPGLDSEALTRIGLGFYQAERYDQAAAALGRAAEVSPMDRDALEWWARTLYADSAWTEIPDVADRWIELDPRGQQAYAILAQAANNNGDTPRAAAAIQAVQALDFVVNDLSMRRTMNGATVTGAVSNTSLDEGTEVTLTFTFYSPSGSEMGTVTQAVQVGGQGMNQLFQVQFDSAEMIGGYGYQVGG